MKKILVIVWFCWMSSAFATDLGSRLPVEVKIAQFHLDAAAAEANMLPNTGVRDFYLCNILIYKYLSTQNETYLKAFDELWDDAVDEVEDLPDSLALRNVMLAELYGKRSALEFLQENYLTAIRLVRTCRRLIRKNEGKFPDNIEQKKFLGLFNVVFAAVPKKYHWLTHTLGYKGDMALGMKQLEEAAAHSSMLRLEAQFIAFYAEKNMLGRPEQAISRLAKERNKVGGNILFDFLLSSAYCSVQQNEKSLELLEQRARYADDPNVFFITYWDYALGKGYYYQEKYTSAKTYLSKFLDTHKGNIFRTDATFRLGMALSLTDNDRIAQIFFQSLQDTKPSPFDEDEYAMHMAKLFAEKAPSPFLKDLFRARNLFDGGYHTRALQVLTKLEGQKNELSSGELAELYYRFGRVYHSLGELTKATQYYQESIAQPPSDQLWMQVYAHFYLGQMLKDAGDHAAASLYFNKALTFDKYFYQGGLENRCKAALAEMG